MHCSCCGSGNDEGTVFCSHCGYDMQASQPVLSCVVAHAETSSPNNGKAGIWLILSIAFSLGALLFYPLLSGSLALLCAYMVKKKRDPAAGITLIFIALACILAGLFIILPAS